ncbi:hypothetical protein DNTS_018829 [Danionella cerebrum]|uniref:Uncharacterized protein n=1 Tax=Danionella cerebrum TaxID=2873325 RepID=A0A553PMN0_9TELE|nr:hypothetical protein DNTS_018829 [Danionella translucida]
MSGPQELLVDSGVVSGIELINDTPDSCVELITSPTHSQSAELKSSHISRKPSGCCHSLTLMVMLLGGASARWQNQAVFSS